MEVVRTDKATCELFVKNKHYSRRASIFWAGFALIEQGLVQGVCVFGQPSAPIQKHAFSDRDFKLYELSRLVVQTKTKNAASFLVSNSLNMLERPCAVVSYADEQAGHCGIVYQATNWLYTGKTVSHDHMYLVDGQKVHPMSLRDKGITSPKTWAKENNIPTIKPEPKHRYFFLCGTAKQKRKMLGKLKYPVEEAYPKRQKTMYDDGPLLNIPHRGAAEAMAEQWGQL
jgi:hypothetical protein